METVIGIDEVGRGPIAGPVSVCALRLSTESLFHNLSEFRESKKLTHKQRLKVFEQISAESKRGALDYAVIHAPAERIDLVGISSALRECVAKSLKNINASDSETVLLDGLLYAPENYVNQRTIVRGDESELPIALASIVAKVVRDDLMARFDTKWSGYGFGAHKGYGTAQHREAIERLGLSPVHRKSFCSRFIKG